MSSRTPSSRVPQARLALCIGPADTYRLERLEADPGVASVAFALTKGGDPLTVKNVGATYHVRQDPAGWSECDCPDCTYRQKACKHLLALHSLGLLPLPPRVQSVEQLAASVPATSRPRYRSTGDYAANDPAGYARELTYPADDDGYQPDYAA